MCEPCVGPGFPVPSAPRGEPIRDADSTTSRSVRLWPSRALFNIFVLRNWVDMCGRDVFAQVRREALHHGEQLASRPLPHERNDPKCTWHVVTCVCEESDDPVRRSP